MSDNMRETGLRHGPLAGQDLGKLRAGSSVLATPDGLAVYDSLNNLGNVVCSALDGPFRWFYGQGQCRYIGELADLSNPAESFINAPEGGWTENPVPGMRIEIKTVPGHVHTGPSEDWQWTSGTDVVAFRLASPATQAEEATGGEGARYKVTWVNDASNENDRRMYVDGSQWAKVYGWDNAPLNARCDILQSAFEALSTQPQPARSEEREAVARVQTLSEKSGKSGAFARAIKSADAVQLRDDLRTILAALAKPAGSEDQANHDCLAKRRPGEPMFILLGRDPDAHNIVRSWAERRLAAGGDPEHCQMGLDTAERMQAYASDPANAPASAPPASNYAPPASGAVGQPVGEAQLVRDLPRYSINQAIKQVRALELARDTFDRYEDLHRKKGPVGREKAEVNAALAIQMRVALGDLPESYLQPALYAQPQPAAEAGQVERMREAVESIRDQAAQADDPDHHTLGLIKHIALAALSPSTEEKGCAGD